MERKPNKRLRSHFYDALLPHHGNGFKPLLFTATGVGAVVVTLLLVQSAYFVQTKVVFTETNFLASVLPGVLTALTNEDRKDSGLSTLTEDSVLARAAQMKAEDMAAKGYFSHVDPEGRQPWYWFQRAGYEYQYAGENLAVNFTDSEDVQEAWMDSPTHHANIVKPQYTRIGIGVAKGEYKGNDTTFVVQFFATPKVAVVTEPEPESEPAPAVAAVSEPQSTEVEEDIQVLGLESGAGVPPAQTIPVAPESPESVQEGPLAVTLPAEVDTAVAAAEEVGQNVSTFAATAATSPNHTLMYVLAGLAALLSVLLLVAIAAHMRVQYLEVAGGGLLTVTVALSLLVFNAMNAPTVTIPEQTQAASVVSAF